MSLIRTAGRAAVASSVHGRVQRRQQDRWAAQAASQQAHAAPQPVAPQSVAQPVVAPAAQPVAADPKSQLMNALTSLRSAGVVTDTEFAEISSRIFS